jgi:glucoamylase
MLSEVYWPRLDEPQTADLELVVTDGRTFADRERDATTHEVELADPQALVYRQTDTARSGRYRIVKTTITNPARDAVLVDVDLQSLDGGSYRAYAYYDPALAGTGAGDSGSSEGDALLASDGDSASALVCSCGFVRTSSGYAGTSSDGLVQLEQDYDLRTTYDSASAGNVVQTGDTGGATRFTLALGFGNTTAAALDAARASLSAGFATTRAAYEQGAGTTILPRCRRRA